MKVQKVGILIMMTALLVLCASMAVAGDFDWTRDLNIRAEADRNGFRAQLSGRFHIGGAQVDVVLGNVDSPADAYMVLRLGEMSGKPADYVLNQYRSRKHQGWGVLAKSLGIKPGSQEFKALKEGHDIYTRTAEVHDRKKGRKKGR